MNKKFRKGGYTLIEMLIYLVLMTGMVIILTVSVVIIMRSYGQFRDERAIVRSSTVTLERIIREVRQANSVNTGQSTLGTSPGVLTLNSTDVSGTPLTIQFSVAGGRIMVRENGVQSGALTAEGANVSNFTVNRLVTPHSEGVTITLTLESGTGSRYVSETFTATAMLRGSY